jgi:hypothetical protein
VHKICYCIYRYRWVQYIWKWLQLQRWLSEYHWKLHVYLFSWILSWCRYENVQRYYNKVDYISLKPILYHHRMLISMKSGKCTNKTHGTPTRSRFRPYTSVKQLISQALDRFHRETYEYISLQATLLYYGDAHVHA